jgi:[acyl-carrier-protein] S-malonyltransferase
MAPDRAGRYDGPMSVAMTILCPGQGAQAVGMGKAWFDASPEAKAVFEKSDRQLGTRLGSPLSELCFAGPAERLNQTDVSQPALYVAGVASWRAIIAGLNMGNGEQPIAATAGLSLGEYTALHVAGAISFEDGLELVTLRGRAMQDAAVASEGGMIALIGATDQQAEEVAAGARGAEVLVCANFNAPGQVVLSGHKSACERAAKVAEGMGLRGTLLQVAGAFHSPLMAPAADRLLAALNATAIKEPKCAVVSNVTGTAHAAFGGMDYAGSVRRRLFEQLTAPVRWAQGCGWLASRGAESGEYHELAPGKTLMGLMRRIDKNIKVTTHDTP